MTLLYFVWDDIHVCFIPLLTQKQKLYTWKDLLYVYVCVQVNLGTNWFDQLVFQRQALAPSTLQGEESPIHRNPYYNSWEL